MSKICIIPARGGSKRIPRKNIKKFLEKPIIGYSIESALESGIFDEVMVSTDDDEIAEIAIKYGAKVPFMRSKENADDFATTYNVLEEVLENYQEKKIFFNYGCCIYPCAPLLNKVKIVDAFQKIIETKCDVVCSVASYSTPIQRALRLENEKIKMFYPEYRDIRSQELERAYFDAGQFYWFSVERILKEKSLYTLNSSYLSLSDLEVQDIDNESDWKIAELKYKILNNLI